MTVEKQPVSNLLANAGGGRAEARRRARGGSVSSVSPWC